jgi:antirestriction protein ArdC
MGGRFGSEAYAIEELVAKLSSAMLGAELGLLVEHLAIMPATSLHG